MNKKPQSISSIMSANVFLSKLSRHKLLEICAISVIEKILPLKKLNKNIAIKLIDNELFIYTNSSILRHALLENKNLIFNQINNKEFIKDNPIAAIHF